MVGDQLVVTGMRPGSDRQDARAVSFDLTNGNQLWNNSWSVPNVQFPETIEKFGDSIYLTYMDGVPWGYWSGLSQFENGDTKVLEINDNGQIIRTESYDIDSQGELPRDLFIGDDSLYLIGQTYIGNSNYETYITKLKSEENINDRIRGNSIYSIVEGPNWTWKEAQSESLKLGGNLTTINNAEENQWLVDTFGFQNSLPVIDDFQVTDPSETWAGHWIGYTDEENEGQWEWISGESSTYHNWHSPYGVYGPDNNYANIGGQDYAIIAYQGGERPGIWDDLTNTDRAYRGISETPFVRRGDSAYTIVEGSTWEDAEANANKLGGHLITINDAEENDWLITQYYFYKNLVERLTNKNLWIGLTDKNEEGTWEWISGESVDYLNWASDEPRANHPEGSDDYAAIGLIDYQSWRNLGDWVDSYNNAPNGIQYGIAEIKLSLIHI